ncbi:MAG: hypothetical protein R8P61_25175 [Bacteroidia bacterium]|nr:hypothetical protein [Bacteroidia bacterium]
MKIRTTFFTILLLLSFYSLSAQQFHGVNTASISANGTQGSTQLNTPQWICEYDAGNSILSMKAKMAAFGFSADANGKSILNEVFFVEANPLIRVDVDFSQLMLQAGSSREESNLSLPVEIRFNNREIRTQANISNFRMNPQGIQMGIDIPLNLQEFGLDTTSKHAANFSNSFNLRVDQMNMKAR